MRGINDRFIYDLKAGNLKPFLEVSKTNPSICLEVRDAYINLYYKGGNALRIEQKSKDYTFYFDSKYCLNKGKAQNYQQLDKIDKRNCEVFQNAFPLILSEMDSWFVQHPKQERDFQHSLIKNNQVNPIVIDIEYAGWTSNNRGFRLDMLGLYKLDQGYRMVVFENKFGNGAIGGPAGLGKHYLDIVDILSNKQSRADLCGSIINIANNKTELGLIDLPLKEKDILDEEIFFLIAGFNMKSKSIANEVKSIKQSIPARICYVTPNNTIIDYSNAKDLFADEH